MRFEPVIAGVAVGALGTVGVPAAHASPQIMGFLCSFVGSYDPTGTIAEPGTVHAEIDGGPIAAADPDEPLSDATVWIACSIQVNHPTHAGPDAAHAEGWGYGVAYLPPTVASYQAAPTDYVYLCTEVRVLAGDGHVSVYHDEVSGELMDDPSLATCDRATSGGESTPGEARDALCAIAANVPEAYDEVCAQAAAEYGKRHPGTSGNERRFPR